MNRIIIKPRWMLREDGDQQQQRLPTLLRLLAAIDELGSLTKACATVELSYRHAWGLLKNATQIFSVPLVRFTRGQGAQLTEIGEKLVWADRRITARLSPILDSLAAEIGAEIERASSDSTAILRIHASHGYAVTMLRDLLHKRRVPVELQFLGSADALASLCHFKCELAGFHVPTGDYQSRVLEHYARWLKPQSQKLINVITRRQGLMFTAGNPRNISGLSDLLTPRIRFANRQRGSGTRMLLELMLKTENIATPKISGYEIVEFTHDAVAAYIASGMADVGFGVEAAARRFKLDFIPLASERYFLVCYDELIASHMVQEVVATLQSIDFRAYVNNHHGLDSTNSGAILSIDEAFRDFSTSD